MRILSRQFLIDEDIALAKNRKVFDDKVMELMPDDPNRFNQALMELGALVCTPKEPKCGSCPIGFMCEAYHKGIAPDYPKKSKKAKADKIDYMVFLIKKEKTFWMEKRPSEGLLAHLWGFPMVENSEVHLEKNVSVHRLKQVSHVFTHKKWGLSPVLIPFEKQNISNQIVLASKEGKFVTLEEMQELPIATAFKKVIEELQEYMECK
jgi:A/G-specific adenine glycosylase